MIHWLGAGLSSTPGIHALAKAGYALTVWNRTVSKAEQAVQGLPSAQARAFSMQDFTSFVQHGDVVVSMLPANMHPEIAQACLFARAHLVTTSYISDAMKALTKEAYNQELCFINEAGLDPGLDHLLAHKVVAEFRDFEQTVDEPLYLRFQSLCGGFPKKPGEFCYKFSWSPLGVLRALKNEARFLKDGELRHEKFPWKSLFPFEYKGELFEAYPNRDSIPYLTEYGLDSLERHAEKADDTVVEFIRGTIRHKGWSKAWKSVFETIENGTVSELEALSDELWKKHRYEEGEEDRILLYVSLEAFTLKPKKTVWSKAYSINEFGKGQETAMARTVSLPASFAVESILQGKAPYGVSGAPTDLQEGKRWLNRLSEYGINIQVDRPLLNEENLDRSALL